MPHHLSPRYGRVFGTIYMDQKAAAAMRLETLGEGVGRGRWSGLVGHLRKRFEMGGLLTNVARS